MAITPMSSYIAQSGLSGDMANSLNFQSLGGGAYSSNTSTNNQNAFNVSQGTSQGTSQSSTYIPEYSQTPILNEIAQYSRSMAPQVYQWGMDQFNKNQGNIDQMMKNAMAYASPQRIAQEMGMAQSGVQQAAEKGRQNAISDLQSYGIDPTSGRYAALDTANRVMSGAMAAGAGNQQRMATEAAGNAQQNQAIAASNANVQTGYGASNAMNQLLGTGMQLKYSPLGTVSSSQNTAQNTAVGGSSGTSSTTGFSSAPAALGTPYNQGEPQHATTTEQWGNTSSTGGAPLHQVKLYAEGGEVPDEVSKSNGGKVDDVPANLTAGEFIIPKDVVAFKGQEFFYKLMAQARKMRAMGGGDGGGSEQQSPLGYGAA